MNQEIEQIELELRMERQRGALADGGKITQLEARLSELQAVVNEQEKAIIVDSLAQQIQDYNIFESLFPEKEYQSLFGLTEYNEKRQQMNQILHQLAVIVQSPLVDKQTAERLEFTAQIRSLKDAKIQLEDEVVEYEAQFESLKVETDMMIDELKNKLAAKDADIANLNEQLTLKQTHIDQLRIDLANAPAPKVAIDVTPVTNTDFEKLLAETKAKSIKSATELALSGSSFRGKVILSSDGQTPLTSGITPPQVGGGSESGNSFRSEDSENNSTVTTDAGVPTTEVASGSVEQTPTLEQLATWVAELQTAVFGQAKTAA